MVPPTESSYLIIPWFTSDLQTQIRFVWFFPCDEKYPSNRWHFRHTWPSLFGWGVLVGFLCRWWSRKKVPFERNTRMWICRISSLKRGWSTSMLVEFVPSKALGWVRNEYKKNNMSYTKKNSWLLQILGWWPITTLPSKRYYNVFLKCESCVELGCLDLYPSSFIPKIWGSKNQMFEPQLSRQDEDGFQTLHIAAASCHVEAWRKNSTKTGCWVGCGRNMRKTNGEFWEKKLATKSGNWVFVSNLASKLMVFFPEDVLFLKEWFNRIQ